MEATRREFAKLVKENPGQEQEFTVTWEKKERRARQLAVRHFHDRRVKTYAKLISKTCAVAFGPSRGTGN